MAVVYKAYDTRLERDVAVKIIRSDAFPVNVLDEILKRFEREAKSLAKLSHPNIVKVHDYGEHEGSPYLVMEYLPGGTLKKLLGRPIPWQDAVRLILPVARGVAYAHKRGILHRDIKPANVLITDDGEPMLSDFGIAKLFEAEQTTALTGSGMAIGTPEYMAPEQWTGVTSPQSDLYSLGIVLYEMVAGRKPYVADTPAAILIKQATEPLPSPRKFAVDLPDDLELALIKVLAKEPADRYKDVNTFIGALDALHIGTPVMAPPVPETKLAEKPVTIPTPETVASVPRQAPIALGGETISAVELETVQGSLPAPIPVKRTRPTIQFSRKWIGLLIGGVALVLVAWLGSPLIGKWFSPAAVPTETVTATRAVSTQPILPSQTVQPSLTPTETIIPTATSLSPEITDNKGVSMMLVPAGEFTMGSNDGNQDEKPAHKVYLDAFYMDKYEVSNAMYKKCVNAGFCEPPLNPNSFTHYNYYHDAQYANYPVINVDWLNASNYCEWVDERLPSEAEWEKAARGTDERMYPWGNIFDGTQANIIDANNYLTYDVAPVDSYPDGVSVYGIFHMVGNVPEWVNDWYDKDYYVNSPERNPKGPNNGSLRILRGGPGYFRSTEHLSLTYARLSTDPLIIWNIPNDPTMYYKYTGFRCATDVTTLQSSATQTPTPEPVNISSTQITDDKGVAMVLVSEGKFIMGSDHGYADEKPVHEVYLDPYYIDKYEVTNTLYKACVTAGMCKPPRDAGSNTRSEYYYNVEFDNYPVIYMNWDQAKTYCEWRDARLPTEAEWEKAARGTDGPDPWWKDAIDCGKSKYFQCTNDTAEVGSYMDGVSPYGAYDMVGNVWEWVSDWYSSEYYSISPDTNPQGPSTGKFRALRGGFYFFNNHWFNSGTHRSGTVRSYIYDYMIGFRCARDATP